MRPPGSVTAHACLRDRRGRCPTGSSSTSGPSPAPPSSRSPPGRARPASSVRRRASPRAMARACCSTTEASSPGMVAGRPSAASRRAGSRTSSAGSWTRSSSTSPTTPSTACSRGSVSCSLPSPAASWRGGTACPSLGRVLACAVWGPPERNPWIVALVGAILQGGHAPDRRPVRSGRADLRSPGRSRTVALLDQAGFTDVGRRRAAPGVMRYDERRRLPRRPGLARRAGRGAARVALAGRASTPSAPRWQPGASRTAPAAGTSCRGSPSAPPASLDPAWTILYTLSRIFPCISPGLWREDACPRRSRSSPGPTRSSTRSGTIPAPPTSRPSGSRRSDPRACCCSATSPTSSTSTRTASSSPVADTSQALGLGQRDGNSSPIVRTLNRLSQFDLACDDGRGTVAVRRNLPPINPRHVRRLPAAAPVEHAEWAEARLAEPPLAAARRRARQMAFTLLEQGDDPDHVERVLARHRLPPRDLPRRRPLGVRAPPRRRSTPLLAATGPDPAA